MHFPQLYFLWKPQDWFDLQKPRQLLASKVPSLKLEELNHYQSRHPTKHFPGVGSL